MTLIAILAIVLVVIGIFRLAQRDYPLGAVLIIVGILLYPGGNLILR